MKHSIPVSVLFLISFLCVSLNAIFVPTATHHYYHGRRGHNAAIVADTVGSTIATVAAVDAANRSERQALRRDASINEKLDNHTERIADLEARLRLLEKGFKRIHSKRKSKHSKKVKG